MNIVLFSPLVRASLAAAALALLIAAVVAVRRGYGGPGALLGLSGLIAGRALGAVPQI
jgi:hypothetical protein